MYTLFEAHRKASSNFGHPAVPALPSTNKDTYQYITKTRALQNYRLKMGDLLALRSHQVDNPHYKISHPMQLYLLSQIERTAAEKWGSKEPYIVALM